MTVLWQLITRSSAKELNAVWLPQRAFFPNQSNSSNQESVTTWWKINVIIIHQTHYEKSDWPRAFNQFTIACELDMRNVISAADIAFIMSSSTSAWLLSPFECSSQKQNGWTLRFCFWGWIMWKMYNKTNIEFGFRMISWIIKTSCLCYNRDIGFDYSWYHAQPHPIIIVNWLIALNGFVNKEFPRIFRDH